MEVRVESERERENSENGRIGDSVEGRVESERTGEH